VTRFDAIGADNHFSNSALIHGPHALQIGVEAAFVDVMSVADIISHKRLFAANFAHSGHDPILL